MTIETAPDDPDPAAATIIHSASYRAKLSPTIYTEAGGLYLGMDQVVHNATEERLHRYEGRGTPRSEASTAGDGVDDLTERSLLVFSDLSMWDTFRSLHPWLFLVDEPLTVGVARSIVEMTEQQKAFPRWVR